ncbi:substrate-binding periplasmic protein [Arenibaculum pallidiluteum]|uniref:substrate-binding periplasmic protein n=1 Tax=Arenibaculum pallidiluteum TaxID=2812559 RepID=UPI001A96AFD5|nr:ABC transporter substrate-binding protein [Arenibaculum pallidiluteum]
MIEGTSRRREARSSRNRSLLALLLAVLACFASGPAMAEFWTVSSESYFPPYNFTLKGKRTGMDTEIVEAMLARLGKTPVHRPGAWSDVVKDLDTNQTDIAFQFLGSGKRARIHTMIGPYRDSTTVIMTRKDSPIVFESIEDLRGLKIGVVSGFDYSPEFDRSDVFTRLVSSGNVINFRRLMLGRVDAIVGDREVLKFQAESDGHADAVRILPKPLNVTPRYIAVPKERKEKAEMLQAAFEEIKADGTLARIIKTWIPQDE